MVVPAGATVTATTGDGYKGVHMDEKAKGNVAEWLVPRLAPKDAKAFTISLSQAPANPADLKGTVRWAKPADPRAVPTMTWWELRDAPARGTLALYDRVDLDQLLQQGREILELDHVGAVAGRVVRILMHFHEDVATPIATAARARNGTMCGRRRTCRPARPAAAPNGSRRTPPARRTPP